MPKEKKPNFFIGKVGILKNGEEIMVTYGQFDTLALATENCPHGLCIVKTRRNSLLPRNAFDLEYCFDPEKEDWRTAKKRLQKYRELQLTKQGQNN